MPDTPAPSPDGVPRPLVVAGGWAWRLLAIGLAVLALGTVLTRLAVVVLPLLVALIITTIAVPPARALERRGVPRAGAAGIVVLGSLAVLVLLVVAIAPSFADQVAELTPTVRTGFDNFLDLLAQFGFDDVRLQELVDQVREQASGSSSAIISGVAGGLAVAAQGVAGLALLIVLVFFLVKDGVQIVDWMIARTPTAQRELLVAMGRRAWQALAGYVRGTALVALIDAVFIGIGLAILGVTLVLPLSLLVFLGAFIPVVGAFIAGLLAVLVALADGGLVTALIALAVVVGVQQLEGNVLQPMIMRRAIALHPVVVLLALAAGASLAGIVGAFLSLPVAAVAAAVGNEVRLRSAATLSAAEGQGTDPADPAPA